VDAVAGQELLQGRRAGRQPPRGQRPLAVKVDLAALPDRPGGGGRLAFDFETRIERGASEPAVDVLVIDYAPVERNPRLVIRSIRDELVQVVPGAHLGRILWRHADGRYTNIGYFALRTPVG
jgi:hypothetical protein